MNAHNQTQRRRRSWRWTPEEIDALVRYQFLGFLPDEEVRIKVTRGFEKRAEIEEIKLDEDMMRSIDDALRYYSGRRVPSQQLKSDVTRLMAALCKREGVLDLSLLAESRKYIDSRLDSDWLNDSSPPLAEGGEYWMNVRQRLSEQSQKSCLFHWIQFDATVWSDAIWRECMLLRYDPRGTSPAEWLDADICLALDALAELHRGTITDVVKAWELLCTTPQFSSAQGVRFVVACEYLLARASRNDSLMALLSRPASETRFFEMIADIKYASSTNQNQDSLSTAREQFLRFLGPGIVPLRENLGNVIALLIRLELAKDDPQLPALPLELAEIWPVPMDFEGDALKPPDAYIDLALAYSKALGIAQEVFWEIWGMYNVYSSRRARARRQPVSHTVFWAAYILEVLKPDLCAQYRQWIDHFHRMVKDSLGEDYPDVTVLYAKVGPFYQCLSSDPLLNILFHSDVFGGRDLLTYRPGRGGPDFHFENLTLAYAQRRLRKVWPTPQVPSVNEIISTIPDLPMAVRDCVGEKYLENMRSGEVGLQSLYAYLAPLAVSVFGADSPPLDPISVKSRCREYDHHPDVELLLKVRDSSVASGHGIPDA